MLAFANVRANPAEYLPPAPSPSRGPRSNEPNRAHEGTGDSSEDIERRVELVLEYVSSMGFVFEPWHIAAFITAVRTKPFVILAGISGTGKTKLPRLVAEATGAECLVVPVRPSWSDSSDLLGYERLDGKFQPGALLVYAREALANPGKQYFLVLDEMNIARVEYYLAEVLSHLEEKFLVEGRLVSRPLVPYLFTEADKKEWAEVGLPGNLCIVGSVNMDETTFGFSRKVLDRAFVVELSKVDLPAIGEVRPPPATELWTSFQWQPRAQSLAAHPSRGDPSVEEMIDVLAFINQVLERAQLQFGYRVRDEIIMFCLAARECSGVFVTSRSGSIDPLDLAIAMKVLPRIQGGGVAIREILDRLQIWASPSSSQPEPAPIARGTSFPLCAERIAIMAERLDQTAFTSFWL